MRVSRFLVFLAGLVGARGAAAQSLAYFEPAQRVADELELGFVRERAGLRAAESWPTSDTGWLFLRSAGEQHNFEASMPSPDDARRWRLALGAESAALVGWDLPARVEETGAAALRAFLTERDGAQALALVVGAERRANEPLRVTRLESLALHVRGAVADGTALSKSGQRMEMRALLDPAAAVAGGDLVFKLYLPPGGDQGVFCRAVQLETGATLALARNSDGVLRTRLAPAGPWRLEAHRLRAVEGGLELASTTLVFELPAAKVGGR